METPKVFESEYRFLRLLWDHEPIRSGALVELAGSELGWKPTTVYTVIKRLAQRGVLENRESVVRSLVAREQIERAEIDELVEKKFDGSLPAFIAAFARGRRLSSEETEELMKLIDGMRDEK
ncbi:MAG: BlaI/MecI/CopY family transcriptional regulator [Clostridia bacterium]|nr:BlaI/MecI/CopY family transcriptional regulator [Clostridia bacterium]